MHSKKNGHSSKQRVVLYARVSTREQDTAGQLRQLRQFVRRFPDWTLCKEYVDKETGSRSHRAQFQALFADAAAHRFDLVVFWSLDRFSREGAVSTLAHLQRLAAAGVGFKSYTQEYLDSTGLFRDALIALLAALAQQERLLLSERTKVGLARARAKGRRLGRPPIQADLSELAALRRRLPMRLLVARTGWSRSTVQRLLRRAAD